MKKILIILFCFLTLTSYSQIIIDHTSVDQYDDIPAAYITEVKKMRGAIPGLSHASGYLKGLNDLETLDATYQVTVQYTGVAPTAYTTSYLRFGKNVWDAQIPGWTAGYDVEEWCTTVLPYNPITNTKAGITYTINGGWDLDALGFGWCWDTEININDYISATQQYVDYCVAQSYDTKIYFTTGNVSYYKTVGTSSDYNQYLKYETIRNYVKADPDLILFDYADILCWDNAGNQKTVIYSGNTYPWIAADNAAVEGDADYYAHISLAGCMRIAKAIWVMMARIAGWEGVGGATLPTVTTTAASAITTITATGGGNVTADGGATVSARGICWNTTGTPTIASLKTTNGTGTGVFVSSMTGLIPSTTYYVRAYATNSVGTAYGNQVNFATLAPEPPEGSIYYVSTTGSDVTGDGSIGNPFRTIQYAEDLIVDGAGGYTIYVRGGEYNERIMFASSSGTALEPNVLMAYNNEVVIIDGTGQSIGAGGALVFSWSSYIQFINLTIRNANMTGVYAAGTGLILAGVGCLASHLEIYNCWAGAARATNSNNIFEYCNIYDVCMSNEGGTESGWSNALAIRAGDAGPVYENCIIRYCTVRDAWGEGIVLKGVDNSFIEDCVIYNTFSVALYLRNSQNCIVQRNLIYQQDAGFTGRGIAHWNESGMEWHINSDNVIINNIVYG